MMGTPEALRLENERLQRELGQARAALEEFTSSVSHDLRASLRHVSAYVQVIQEDLGDLGDMGKTAIAAHLERVRQAARQMGRQMDGLTELSRLARVDLQVSTLDAGSLLCDARSALAPALAGRTVDWRLAPDFPALSGDAALLRQVWLHLLSNAVKFTFAREVAEIAVTWQTVDAGQCALTVADNGVGFNLHCRDKLFHAFQRLHSAREFEGLGMGLALSRKIVERHGGTVWADGAPDAGCSVSFTWPLARPAN